MYACACSSAPTHGETQLWLRTCTCTNKAVDTWRISRRSSFVLSLALAKPLLLEHDRAFVLNVTQMKKEKNCLTSIWNTPTQIYSQNKKKKYFLFSCYFWFSAVSFSVTLKIISLFPLHSLRATDSSLSHWPVNEEEKKQPCGWHFPRPLCVDSEVFLLSRGSSCILVAIGSRRWPERATNHAESGGGLRHGSYDFNRYESGRKKQKKIPNTIQIWY